MEYYVFKLNFTVPVHFGNGRLNETEETFCADTLFSAMFKEVLKIYGVEGAKKFYEGAVDDKILLSDAMPFIKDELYVPKPVLHIKAENDDGNSVKKKAFKKLKYIPLKDIDVFAAGNYEPPEVEVKFGKKSVRDMVHVIENDDNLPYNVGLFEFEENSGLYFIAGIEGAENEDFVFDAVESLSYMGIGGKVSSGFGKFVYTFNKSDEIKMCIEKKAKMYMSLSVSMAENEQLNNALDGASYALMKRSGFVASEQYSQQTLKKNDFYCFKSGSCFKNKFKGSIFDVSSKGNHPVYRYAKPLFLGLEG